jgi:hypothetical protein
VAQSIFRSLQNKQSPAQMAVAFALQDIEAYRATRMALGEDAPEPPENIERLRRLAVLMKGPHGAKVRPVVERAFPSLKAPEGHA